MPILKATIGDKFFVADMRGNVSESDAPMEFAQNFVSELGFRYDRNHDPFVSVLIEKFGIESGAIVWKSLGYFQVRLQPKPMTADEFQGLADSELAKIPKLFHKFIMDLVHESGGRSYDEDYQHCRDIVAKFFPCVEEYRVAISQ